MSPTDEQNIQAKLEDLIWKTRTTSATLSISAAGKEYAAPWLKNAKTITRGADGRFFSGVQQATDKAKGAAKSISDAASKVKADATSKAKSAAGAVTDAVNEAKDVAGKIKYDREAQRKAIKEALNSVMDSAEDVASKIAPEVVEKYRDSVRKGITEAFEKHVGPQLNKANPDLDEAVQSALADVGVVNKSWAQSFDEAKEETAKEMGAVLGGFAVAALITSAVIGPEFMVAAMLMDTTTVTSLAAGVGSVMAKVPIRAADKRRGNPTIASKIAMFGLDALTFAAGWDTAAVPIGRATLKKMVPTVGQAARRVVSDVGERAAQKAAGKAAGEAAGAAGQAAAKMPKTTQEMLDLLGMSKPPETLAELKRAFYAAAKKNHPDVGGNEEAMKAINEAFDLLKRRHFGD